MAEGLGEDPLKLFVWLMVTLVERALPPERPEMAPCAAPMPALCSELAAERKLLICAMALATMDTTVDAMVSAAATMASKWLCKALSSAPPRVWPAADQSSS